MQHIADVSHTKVSRSTVKISVQHSAWLNASSGDGCDLDMASFSGESHMQIDARPTRAAPFWKSVAGSTTIGARVHVYTTAVDALNYQGIRAAASPECRLAAAPPRLPACRRRERRCPRTWRAAGTPAASSPGTCAAPSRHLRSAGNPQKSLRNIPHWWNRRFLHNM